MDSKKIIEAAVLGGVLVVSANAFAQTAACTSGTAAASVAGGSTSFVKSAFTPKCSANVYVSILDSTASFSVKSNSIKGKSDFGGSTDSGGIAVCSTWTTHAVPTASTTGC